MGISYNQGRYIIFINETCRDNLTKKYIHENLFMYNVHLIFSISYFYHIVLYKQMFSKCDIYQQIDISFNAYFGSPWYFIEHQQYTVHFL